MTPIFDHSKTASEVQSGSQRFIEQDGNLFSYAIYNRQEKRYEPEPVFIPPHQKSFEEMSTMARRVLSDLRLLQKSIDELTFAISNKIGIGEMTPKKTSTSPFEESYLADLPPIPDLVEDDAVKKKVVIPRKRNLGGRPRKKV